MKDRREPWSFPGHGANVYDADGRELIGPAYRGYNVNEDAMERAVKCVNALAGIEDPESAMTSVGSVLADFADLYQNTTDDNPIARKLRCTLKLLGLSP